jgi:hypothetical protein
VRTIEVHGACEQGAVPSTYASCEETNVTDVAANPPGTGPPAACPEAGALVAGVVADGVVPADVAPAEDVGDVAGVVLLVPPVPPPPPGCDDPQPASAKVASTALAASAVPARRLSNAHGMGASLPLRVTGGSMPALRPDRGDSLRY